MFFFDACHLPRPPGFCCFSFIWCFDIIIACLSQDAVSMPPPPRPSSDGKQRSGTSQRDQVAKTGVACLVLKCYLRCLSVSIG